jgi:hypothetical protein
MLKKLSIILSLVAALGLVLAAPATSEAKTYKKTTKKVYVHKTVHTNKYVIGHSYGGHVYYGRNRHRWHGRWYAYGVGPCWINVGGIWFWNIAACP